MKGLFENYMVKEGKEDMFEEKVPANGCQTMR